MINNTIQELMERLKQRTLQYAQEHGIVLGNNGFIQCLFPDHEDHDPSMHWWEKTNSFFCFGCGRVCDLSTLANIFEGKPLAGPDFIEENVFYLAEKYGEPYEHLRKSMTADELKRQSYYRTMKLFSDYVTAHKNNQYLLDRKISEDTAKRLNIGGVQDFNDCMNYSPLL